MRAIFGLQDCLPTAQRAIFGLKFAFRLLPATFLATPDEIYIGLTGHIEAGLRRRSKPAYQEACKRLMAIVNQNGRALYSYSYNKQTATLESFFDDLDNDQSRADLETINATEWLKELKAANEAFKKAYAERVKQETSKDVPTNEAALKLLKPSIDSLFTVITAYYINGQVEGIEKTIGLLNEANARSLSAARQGAAQSKRSSESGESNKS